ncbi:MAG TPA: hypothetical protein PLU30_08470 [Verrucomicrobiae bacterium]|nr:hypothetical protein [Verrucomicrobiae bacterium]
MRTTIISAAIVSTATIALSGTTLVRGDDDSPLTQLAFQRSMRSGVRDANGNPIAGTEVMHLVPHKGLLYASTSLWMESDPSIPKACQIIVLDSPKGQWRVEHQFTTNNLRYGSLREVTFSTDATGKAIAPVDLLLAAPDVRSGPVEVFCREETTGDWVASGLGTVTRGATTRAMGLHRDKVTGIDRIFAGNRPLGVISGVYDPAAPGRIRWDKTPEFPTPEGERVMGFCDCNGILYCATTRHIFQRTDGVAPAWKKVYFCEKEIPPVGIRGLTSVPRPGGKGEVLWFVALRKVRRLDPGDGFKETIELDMPVFLTEKLGLPVTGALSAYNELMPYVMPGSGERLWLFGFQCSHPAAVINSHPRIKARVQKQDTVRGGRAGNGRYCIRHAKGADITYEVAEITDPREPQLVSTRTIAVSPFPQDRGKVLYFGGYDCNSVPSHDTAWIYRGEPRAP